MGEEEKKEEIKKNKKKTKNSFRSPVQDICENIAESEASRNFEVSTINGIKTVINDEGKKFIYYENLEDVRRSLGQKYPNMSKTQMYRELLKPYKHKVIEIVDIETGQSKEEYICAYGTCKKRFNKTWNLVDHLRMHEGIRPYKCTV